MAEEITIQLNDESLKVPSGITVKKALQLSGYKITKFPEKEALFVPCEVGGCWSCHKTIGFVRVLFQLQSESCYWSFVI